MWGTLNATNAEEFSLKTLHVFDKKILTFLQNSTFFKLAKF